MKKRDKIIISIIIIVALIAALVVLLFYLNSRNIIKIGNDNKTKQDEQIQEEVSIVQKQAKEKYPSFKWVSDGNITKLQVGIENGNVYIIGNEATGSKKYVKFDKGTPKYASAVIKGGMLEGIFVITTDGYLYFSSADGYGENGFEFEFEFHNLDEKVIDATYADGTDMYYLLEDGTIVNSNGMLK